MKTTDVNYADMVDPYRRMEEEAFERGYRHCFFHVCWFLALCLAGYVAAGL